ncbi:hypothetical protein TNCV_1880001 [Trichonephila clavipes]|nr:hypothetical protein TNCV_1880001 [Trichonephila clavipes]
MQSDWSQVPFMDDSWFSLMWDIRHVLKKGTQQLEIRPGCEETQEESIRTGPESVVANGAALARERKTKLTPPGNWDVNGHVHPNDTQSSR